MAMFCFITAKRHQRLFVSFHARNSNEGGGEDLSRVALCGSRGPRVPPCAASQGVTRSLDFSHVDFKHRYQRAWRLSRVDILR